MNSLRRRWLLFLGVAALVLSSCAARSSDVTAEVTQDTSSIDEEVNAPTADAPTPDAPTADAPTPSGGGVASPLAPGDYVRTVRHDARTRSYIVHVPPGAMSQAPVVIAFHGGGGTGADFQDQNGLDRVADREGFIAVYPEGTGILPNRLHTWNSGVTCCGFALDRNIDDVGFARKMIADLTSTGIVDEGRVYLTGHSNGAMMAYRIATEASDLVTAIVPVGGAVDLAVPQPSVPIPLLHIHSIDDPRALYDGGEGPPFPGTNRTVHHEPVLPGITTWAAANGCGETSQLIESVSGTGADDGHSFERFVWAGCANGATVEHLLLAGSGHGWPGVTAPRLVQRHLGPPTTLVDASEEVWAFASRFES